MNHFHFRLCPQRHDALGGTPGELRRGVTLRAPLRNSPGVPFKLWLWPFTSIIVIFASIADALFFFF